MANEPITTIIGNLTGDPELRYTQSGVPVANFTVASTPRTYDKSMSQWVDGETLFMRCSLWREYAENVAASLQKGQQVIVMGRLVQRRYTPRDGGAERTVTEMQVDEIGPTLRWATARVERKSNHGGGFQQQQPASFNTAPAGGTQDDPWGNPREGQQAHTSANDYGQAPF